MKILTKKTFGFIIATAMMIGIAFSAAFAQDAVIRLRPTGNRLNGNHASLRPINHVSNRPTIHTTLLPNNSDYSMGKKAGYNIMRNEFTTCDYLDYAFSDATDKCEYKFSVASKSFVNGCKAGVKAKYNDLNDNECAPHPEDCQYYGELAAQIIASDYCGIRIPGVPPVSNIQYCYDQAVSACKGNVYPEIQDTCSPYNMSHSELNYQRSKCYDIVESMLGM